MENKPNEVSRVKTSEAAESLRLKYQNHSDWYIAVGSADDRLILYAKNGNYPPDVPKLWRDWPVEIKNLNVCATNKR